MYKNKYFNEKVAKKYEFFYKSSTDMNFFNMCHSFFFFLGWWCNGNNLKRDLVCEIDAHGCCDVVAHAVSVFIYLS